MTHRDVLFAGEKLSIHNPKILDLMMKIEESDFKLNNLDFDGQMTTYLEVFAALDEIQRELSKEKESQGDQEGIVTLINKTAAYFSLQKNLHLYQRNYLQFLHAEERFIRESTLDALDSQLSKRQLKNKVVSPLEMIRWSENLLQAGKQVLEVQRQAGEISEKASVEFEEGMFRNIRCIYIGCLYYQNKHFLESASLFQYIETLLQNSKNYYMSSFKLRFSFE